MRGAAAAAAAAAAAEDSRLLIALKGGSDANGLSHVRPFSLINDINLLTVLESFRLFGDQPAGSGGSPRKKQASGEFSR